LKLSNALKDGQMYGYVLGLLFTCILYISVAIYLDNVVPQGTALNKKWDYIFKKEKSERNADVQIENNNNDQNYNAEFIESDPENQKKVVEVQSLYKHFNNGKIKYYALNNINFNVYSNEIFAILGHNGAGKSTLINIMTGLYYESSGKVLYDGKEFTENKDQICTEIGKFLKKNNNIK